MDDPRSERAPTGAAGRLVRDWSRDWGGRLTLVFGAYVVVYLVWQLVPFAGRDQQSLISDAGFLPVSVAAAVLAFRVSRNASLADRTRRAWIVMGVAFVAYWMGDVLWFVYSHVTKTEPFPSWADAGYLAFYPLMLWGLLLVPVARRSKTDRTKFWLDGGTVLLSGWMVLWFYVLGPTAQAGENDLLTNAISLAYPIADLILVFGVAAIALRRPAEASRWALWVLGSGLLLFVIADIGFGYAELTVGYEGGGWPDSMWMVAQYMMLAAAHVQWWRATPIEEADERRTQTTGSRLPYAAVAISFTLLLFVARQESPYPLGGLVIGAVGVTALVVARQIAVLRENARLMSALHQMATTDGLTGLVNRAHFLEEARRELARAVRYNRPLVAMMIDVDRFKTINDSLGHAVGDDVLRAVADRLRSSLRAADLIGRYGGDELVALLPETTVADAVIVAERVAAALRAEPIVTPTGTLVVTLSIGAADAAGVTDLPALLHRADEALYEAKRAGRDCVRVA